MPFLPWISGADSVVWNPPEERFHQTNKSCGASLDQIQLRGKSSSILYLVVDAVHYFWLSVHFNLWVLE